MHTYIQYILPGCNELEGQRVSFISHYHKFNYYNQRLPIGESSDIRHVLLALGESLCTTV